MYLANNLVHVVLTQSYWILLLLRIGYNYPIWLYILIKVDEPWLAHNFNSAISVYLRPFHVQKCDPDFGRHFSIIAPLFMYDLWATYEYH